MNLRKVWRTECMLSNERLKSSTTSTMLRRTSSGLSTSAGLADGSGLRNACGERPGRVTAGESRRAEERRVGKEGRSRGAPYHLKKRKQSARKLTTHRSRVRRRRVAHQGRHGR